MRIFSDAQGQLTLQSVVESCQISNLYEILWLSSIPPKEDSIKNECPRVLTRLYVVFFRHSMAAYSEVSGGILPKFELIPAFIVVLVTCKNEDQIKNEGARVLYKIFPITLKDFKNAKNEIHKIY